MDFWCFRHGCGRWEAERPYLSMPSAVSMTYLLVTAALAISPLWYWLHECMTQEDGLLLVVRLEWVWPLGFLVSLEKADL